MTVMHVALQLMPSEMQNFLVYRSMRLNGTIRLATMIMLRACTTVSITAGVQGPVIMAVNEASLEAVRRAMHAQAPRVPTYHDRVHKEECAFSFDTAFSPAGIYINLANWQAYGHDFVQLDHQRSGNCLYLHETWKKVSP